MLDLYKSILDDVRAPERVDVLMALTNILYDAEYDIELDSIMQLVATNDSPNDILDDVEGLIFTCARSMLVKLGVHIELEAFSPNVNYIHNLLIMLLEGIEHYDDYTELLTIVDSEEPDPVIIAELTRAVTGNESHELCEIIQFVTPELKRVMRNLLVARSIEGDEMPCDVEKAMRIARLIKMYPNNYVAELLDDNGYMLSEELLVQAVELDEESENFNEDVALVAAGIAIAVSESYEEAANSIERLILNFLPEANVELLAAVSNAAMTALDIPFAEIEEVEDDG